MNIIVNLTIWSFKILGNSSTLKVIALKIHLPSLHYSIGFGLVPEVALKSIYATEKLKVSRLGLGNGFCYNSLVNLFWLKRFKTKITEGKYCLISRNCL